MGGPLISAPYPTPEPGYADPGAESGMGADSIAAMAPMLREALASHEGVCVTFIVTDAPDWWVQYVDGTVNAAWPGAVEPSAVLARLGSATLDDWKAGTYVTATLRLDGAPAIAAWIDRYFREILGAPEGYSVDIETLDL